MAFFGAHELNNFHETKRFSLSPEDIILHDKWNPHTTRYDSDLALLKFEDETIVFNTFVQPICLWDSEKEPIETEGIVAGWGQSEDTSRRHETEPKVIKAEIQTNEMCFFDDRAMVDLSSYRTFCAGLKNVSGVCRGDSGAGLLIKVNNVFHLKGIVSSSITNDGVCDVSKSAVYTNVQKFRDWIAEKTGG